MPLAVTTDHDAMRALLDDAIAADPVRGTVLGTIVTSLGDGAWCARGGERFAVRSAPEHPVTLAGRWDDAALAELAGMLRDLGDVRSVAGEPDVASRLGGVVFAGRPTVAMDQLLFRLDELTAPDDVPGAGRIATASDRTLVREWFAAFQDEAFAGGPSVTEAADRTLDGGYAHLWCDAFGTPASLAARRAVITGSSRIGPVYTPPARRGRGYGSAVTAAATRSILDEGAVPVLFTDVANPTSNKIYQQLGYRPVEYRRMVRVR
jgi:GNAT superfamily N-acetyltransferase